MLSHSENERRKMQIRTELKGDQEQALQDYADDFKLSPTSALVSLALEELRKKKYYTPRKK